jgi:uncharacterized protein YggE
MQNYFSEKKGVLFLGSIVLVVLSLFLFVQTVNGIKTYGTIGEVDVSPNVITVSGTADVSAAPDIATFSFSVIGDGATAADAQNKADPITKKALAYLKAQGIADKDIQTSDYNVAPKYEYQQGICSTTVCPPGRNVLTGYEATQTVTVKVRAIAKAGDILGGVGATGVSNVSNLNLSIENQDALNNQARSAAIKKAQDQAKELAGELGVHLGKITNFSEQGNQPNPIYYKTMDSMAMPTAAVAPTPAIPTGENKITSNVTITYEIR